MIFVIPYVRTVERESVASVLITEAGSFTEAEGKPVALYGPSAAVGNAVELELGGPQSIEVARSEAKR